MPSRTVLSEVTFNDHKDFWRMQVLTDQTWKHTPFISVDKDRNIELHENVEDLEDLDDDTIILKSWAGQWNSNMFKFTKKDLRLAKALYEDEDV